MENKLLVDVTLNDIGYRQEDIDFLTTNIKDSLKLEIKLEHYPSACGHGSI